MLIRKKKTLIASPVDAIDTFASMVEADLPGVSLWKDAATKGYHEEEVKKALRALLQYLIELHGKRKQELKRLEVQQGVQAMMLLVDAAIEKIGSHTSLFAGKENIQKLTEYQALRHFYQQTLLPLLPEVKLVEERWKKEWGSGDSSKEMRIHGVLSLTQVRQDQEYELFFLRQEDGRPFFSRDLLDHLLWVGYTDASFPVVKEEDLFLRLQLLQDRDCYEAAVAMVQGASNAIHDYYKEAWKYKERECVALTGKALMALFLASNPHNLMQNTTGKSAFQYYCDFHEYLRQALHSAEYKRLISLEGEFDHKVDQALIHLIHTLCFLFFFSAKACRETAHVIRKLIQRGESLAIVQKQTASPLALWNTLLDEDTQLRLMLQQYPNGPLMKTLSFFEQGKALQGFDPLKFHNFPRQLYALVHDAMHVSCLRIPAPLIQQSLKKVKIAEEFYGFLRALSVHNRNVKHLLIQLQDRTSWKERERSNALERLDKEENLKVVTFPKDTDFYWQKEEYLSLDDAPLFFDQLKEQIKSGEQCGFYFSKDVNREEILAFTEGAIQLIHSIFFGKKPQLLPKNRRDFIEIFYLLLTLKLIDSLHPDSLSFTCKDAIDTGCAASATLFCFLRMMNDGTSFSVEEKDLILGMLYAPALELRGRAIHDKRLSRMINALEIIQAELDAHRTEVVASCAKLFSLPFFTDLKLIN